MTLRSTPPIATWILIQFSLVPENESAIGDLIERYQRGKGSIWYWRQVLVIVYVGLYREVRLGKSQFFASLIRTWCVWGGLQFLAAFLLRMRYRSIHPLGSDHGTTVNLMPLVTFQALTENHTRVWFFSVLLVTLNILTLLLVGRYIASSPQVHPRHLLLACVTAFGVMDIGLIATNLLLIYLGHPDEIGFLLTDLIALPSVPALLLIGGIQEMRRLSYWSSQQVPRREL